MCRYGARTQTFGCQLKMGDPQVERVELTGHELQRFIARLTEVAANISVLRLRVDGGLKYKINEGGWSPPIGDLRTDEY